MLEANCIVTLRFIFSFHTCTTTHDFVFESNEYTYEWLSTCDMIHVLLSMDMYMYPLYSCWLHRTIFSFQNKYFIST